jgi:hypothetical protein
MGPHFSCFFAALDQVLPNEGKGRRHAFRLSVDKRERRLRAGLFVPVNVDAFRYV